MDTVVNRFIRYAGIYSESDPHTPADVIPSTQRQFDMARMLVEELHSMGVDNARVDEKCYVYAHVPAAPGYEHLPAVGLIAHMDTSPDVTGKDVKPRIIRYEGGDIVLNQEKNIVLEAAMSPELERFKGQELICADGTTLLGADDKAGIAIILQAVEELLAEGKPHGKLCLGFTPDEEVGRGANGFDVKGFGADFAFTVDGGEIQNCEYETFNAAGASVDIEGFSIHPGTAKDRMKNALLIAMELNALLPALETPGHTEGYEGFFHLTELSGKVERAHMEYIIRDHSMERFQQRKAAVQEAVRQMNLRYGSGTVRAEITDQYYNMYEILKDRMEIVRLAEEAMTRAGVARPAHSPVRGGTDGCRLTYMGLPCPNLPTGGYNFHGRFEYIPVESMKTGVKIIREVVSPDLLERIILKKES